ncbi:MAG TPA: glycosyltransferase [Vicingus sp.]|nr:glycosyltransferase [Vicingus sp.]
MSFKTFKNHYEKIKIKENNNIVPNQVLISICIATYNHNNYITKCLEGILIQQTNFNFEILLGEDASTDGTREICIEYAKKYPDKIRLFLHHQENNISVNGSPTGRFNFLYNLYSAKGKYIALCEGDDYWTDPYKLQKQVDFLEANDDVNICFTRALLLKNGKEELQEIPSSFEKKDFNYIELIRHHNFISTASVMFKKPEPLNFPEWFYKVPFGDLGLYKLVSNNKKIHCINEVMTVYRIHDSGVWSGINAKKSAENYLTFYLVIFSALTNEEKKEAKKKIRSLLRKLASLSFPHNKYIAKLYFINLLIKHFNYI